MLSRIRGVPGRALRVSVTRGLAKAVSAEELKSAQDEVAVLIERSRVAQKEIENYTQEQVDRMIKAMVWSCAQPGVAEEIAQFTVDESRLGNYEGKFLRSSRRRARLCTTLSTTRAWASSRKTLCARLSRSPSQLA